MTSHDPARVTTPEGVKLPSWLIVLLMLGIVGIALWQNNHAAQLGTPGSNSAGATLPDEKAPTEPEITPEASDAADQDSTPGADKNKSAPSGSDRSPQTLRSVDPKTFPEARTNPQSARDQSQGRGPLSGMRNKPTSGDSSSGMKPSSTDRTRPTEKSDAPTKGDSTPKTEKSAYLIENQSIRDLYGRVVYKGTIDLKPTLDRIERGENNSHRNDGASFQNREGRLPRKPAGYYKEFVHPTKGEYGPGPQRIIMGKEGEIWYTPDHYKSFKKIK